MLPNRANAQHLQNWKPKTCHLRHKIPDQNIDKCIILNSYFRQDVAKQRIECSTPSKLDTKTCNLRHNIDKCIILNSYFRQDVAKQKSECSTPSKLENKTCHFRHQILNQKIRDKWILVITDRRHFWHGQPSGWMNTYVTRSQKMSLKSLGLIPATGKVVRDNHYVLHLTVLIQPTVTVSSFMIEAWCKQQIKLLFVYYLAVPIFPVLKST